MAKEKTIKERLKALEDVVFAPKVPTCKRCGCTTLEYAPYEVGPRCARCGNHDFDNLVSIYSVR